ncbi:MAG: hypothetical protein KAI47_19865, partial [Deltaproteobacteria bacterium]|nr:hypothetical protein [Deltaproteobacteria bacterium]
MSKKKRLGERLVDVGFIDRFQLRAALGQQVQWGKTLGQTLLNLHLITEEQLMPVLADQLNMPVVELGNQTFNPDALDFLDEEFCRRHECIAFDFQEKTKFLDVAMVDPQSESLFNLLRVHTQCNIRQFLVGPEALRDAIDRAFGEDLKNLKMQFQLSENVFD